MTGRLCCNKHRDAWQLIIELGRDVAEGSLS